MGLLPVPAAYAGPPALPPGNGAACRRPRRRHRRAWCSAWELGRAGYDSDRAGGAHAGRRAQLVAPRRRRDPGNRQRAARALGHGRAPLFQSRPGAHPVPPRGHPRPIAASSACKLEVMCNDNRGAFMQDDAAFGGLPQRNRRGGERRARLRRGTGRQGGGPGPARRARDDGGPGTAARVPARVRRARRGPRLSRFDRAPGSPRRPASRRNGQPASRSICASSCRRISGRGRCSSASSPTRPRP